MSLDLQTIGKKLKEEREQKGLSVVNVSDSLCLRKVIIKAIEDGNWASLPHEVYVRGYIKEYAQLLNITSELLVTEEQVPVNQEIQAAPATLQSTKKEKSLKPQRVGRKAIVYPLIFVLIIAFFVLNQIYKERSLSKVVPLETAQTQPAAANVRAPASTEPQQQALSELSDVKKLMVTCMERTWISVVIDGTEKKEFMLNPEEMVILNAKENFDLLIGNAAGVKLNLNGKEVGMTGQSGEVKRIKVS